MNFAVQGRILPFVGPIAILYALSALAAERGGLDRGGAILAAVAMVVAFLPVGMRHRRMGGVDYRVLGLGLAYSSSLFFLIGPDAAHDVSRIASMTAFLLGSGLTLELAVTSPDRLPTSARWGSRRVLYTSVIVTALPIALLQLPRAVLYGERETSASWLAAICLSVSASAMVWSVVLRTMRRRWGSTPEALASNAWALLGLLPSALALALAGAVFVANGAAVTSAWVRTLAGIAAVSGIAGHIAMMDSRKQPVAGLAVRTTIAASLAALASFGVAWIIDRTWTRDFGGVGSASVWVFVVALVVYRLVRPFVVWLVAPFRGRLLAAITDATRDLSHAHTIEEATCAVLAALRRASLVMDAEAYVFCVSPPREFRLDAAGQPHAEERGLPAPLLEVLLSDCHRIVIRRNIDALAVRRAELRPLSEVLNRWDALCVVPLSVGTELEGALVVPRGLRQSALTLEEIVALDHLAKLASTMISVFSSDLRAQERARKASIERDRLIEQNERLEDEIERIKNDVGMLRSARTSFGTTAPLAYSASMRDLLRRIDTVGPLASPVLLIAENGTDIEQIGRLLHDTSSRGDEPFIVADCASVRPDRVDAALFGEETVAGSDAGWLRLASSGSLLLLDVPSLPMSTQATLAEALAARMARPVCGVASYSLEARLIATSKVELGELTNAGRFHEGLSQWLAPLCLRVPPLRDRMEDLSSLVLLSIDKACRARGRDVVGIDPRALDRLASYEWPGNLPELQAVIERAVDRATTSIILERDFDGLLAGSKLRVETNEPVQRDPFDGTYASLERKILVAAMARARGNKSEAARMLALKRTTFLDKLRRYGLEPASKDSNEDAA